MDEEQSVLRWGDLAGIVGGILLVAVFVIVGVFVGPDPTEPEGLVMRFPDVRAAHVVEEVLYLGVLAPGYPVDGDPAHRTVLSSGGTPNHSPWWVPRELQRSATLSPPAKMSSMVASRAGKALR